MRILVIGSDGQLGCDLVCVLREHGELVVAPSRAELDVTQPESVRKAVVHYGSELIVNCSVYHPVDECEVNVDASFAVNTLAVRHLALIARENGAALVHYSSDFVFDGEADRPYLETDAPSPISVFGVSKVAGEQFVRAIQPRHLIIRTSGLYGVAGCRAKKGNFVETMLRVGREKGEVKVVSDLRIAPTYTRSLAQQTACLIRSHLYGTYHASDHGDHSWFEFAQMIFRLAKMDIKVVPVSWEQMNLLARRPRYSVLQNGRLHDIGLDLMVPTNVALQAYLRERAVRKE